MRIIVPIAGGLHQSLFFLPRVGDPQCLVKDQARGAAIQALMQSLAVIEIEVRGDAMPCLGRVLVRRWVYLLILEVAPEPFDKDVIAEATAPIHTDGDAMRAQYPGESLSVNWLP